MAKHTHITRPRAVGKRRRAAAGQDERLPGMPEAPLSDAERRVLDALNAQAGRRVSGAAIVRAAGLLGTRHLRRIVWRLRSARRIPVVGWPGKQGGYMLAETAEQIKAHRDYCHKMGRDFFAIAAIVQGVTADVVAGQMILDLFPGPDAPGGNRRQDGRPVRRADTPHEKAWALHLAAGQRRRTFVDVLRNLLGHMAEHPDVYRQELEALGKDYGTVLLAGDQARKLRDAAAAITEALGSAGGGAA